MDMFKKSGRKYPRAAIVTEAFLHCNGRKYPAEVINISIGGAYIELKGMLPLRAEHIGLRKPTPIFLEIPRLKLRGASAQIRRAVASGRPHDLKIGVQFFHPRPDIHYRLDQFASAA